MGTGLKKDSGDYNLVVNQIKEKRRDVSGTVPRRQILGFNAESGNWVADKYDYSAFAASVRSLVSDLRTSGEIPAAEASEETEGGTAVVFG